MAGLLVSVRSAEEAIEAVRGGASVVDVKEPHRGPLGRASARTWRMVREVVPLAIPVSVALGELSEWSDALGSSFEGISYRKLGLANAGPAWRSRWAEIRRDSGGEPRWVAVAYDDWRAAGSPEPSEVLDEALLSQDCAGFLIDTWDKTRPGPINPTTRWSEWIARAHRADRFVALAGGLDREAIVRLGPLKPDLFAVRGSACSGGNRRGLVRAELVAELVRATRSVSRDGTRDGSKLDDRTRQIS